MLHELDEDQTHLVRDRHTTHLTEVSAVEDLTPMLRQVTFRGGLDDFESLGGDQFLYVLLPPRGRSALTVDTDFTWAGYEQMSASERPGGAYYSVRSWRPEAGELDMWFVLHGDVGDASAWARRARPGDAAALWGPRRAFEPPIATSSYLIVADETGYGATCAVLDELLDADPEVEATVIVECDGAAGRVEIPTGPAVDVNWLDRAGNPPATTPLVHHVAALALDRNVYAFGAAESERITQVRRHLRDVVGLAMEQVSMTGYWRAS